MNRNEFMESLTYYLGKSTDEETAEILSDYNAHFDEAKEAGLRDEEIIKELGTPQEIYESCKKEGLLTDKGRLELFSRHLLNRTGSAFRKAEIRAFPIMEKLWHRLPGAVEKGGQWLMKIISCLCSLSALALAAATLLTVYMLSVSWQPFLWLPPLPTISPLSLIGLTGTGLSMAGALYFISEWMRHPGALSSGNEGDE